MKSAPSWLSELQSRFGSILRTPLDRSTGTLRAIVTDYDPAMLAELRNASSAQAAQRLAVYHRQYWFRLFGVLQKAFPLTTRLLGHWHFNDHAARFLVAHPPHDWDLDHAPDGFEDFVAHALGDVVVSEAASLDATWHALFRAPAIAPFQPSADDAAGLLDARLDPSPAAAVVVERWPLIELRHTLAAVRGEAALPEPPRLLQARWWALVRETDGVRQVALEPREGELFALLGRHTVRDALAHLEAECSTDERKTLPAKAQRWLARSVQLGLWRSLVSE